MREQISLQGWFVVWVLGSTCLFAGCGGLSDPESGEENVPDSPSSTPYGVGPLVGGGGVPGGGSASGDSPSGFSDSAEVGDQEEFDSVGGESPGFGEGELDSAEGGEHGIQVAYECDFGDEEECVTSCGSIGIRHCGKTWGPCVAPEEICNGLDEDCDGVVDEELLNDCGSCGEPPEEVCNGVDDNCDGTIDEGWLNDCGTCGDVPPEVCNGVDDDCDGSVDEGLLNACGACGPTNAEELCNGIDDDCNGVVDDACLCHFELNISGDCVFAACPDACPYPVGCDIEFQGGDPRGCVAALPHESLVYFQEGNNCGAGSVGGTLTCSNAIGEGLTPNTCSINKEEPIWAQFPAQCPDTN